MCAQRICSIVCSQKKATNEYSYMSDRGSFILEHESYLGRTITSDSMMLFIEVIFDQLRFIDLI